MYKFTYLKFKSIFLCSITCKLLKNKYLKQGKIQDVCYN